MGLTTSRNIHSLLRLILLSRTLQSLIGYLLSHTVGAFSTPVPILIANATLL